MLRRMRVVMVKPKTPEDPLLIFKNVLFLVVRHAIGKDRTPTPTQYDIAEYLQYGPRRLIIQAFRGVGKSFITAAFVVWCLYCNPECKILVVSASKQHADNFTTFVLSLIKGIPEFQHLTPRTDQREAKVQFDVAPAAPAQAPSVKSIGITGQITGSRADVIVADDIETPSNSMTQMMREKLSEAVKEFDAVLKPGGRIVYLGTPQTEESLYKLLTSRKYETRVWPARYPVADYGKTYGDTLSPFYSSRLKDNPGLVGHPTDIRFSDMDLREREISYGRSGFALQFMLDTRLSDALRYPLKVEDLLVMNTNPDKAPESIVWAADPRYVINDLPNVAFSGDRYYRPMAIQGEWLSYQGSVLAIDPAGRGTDETGYAVVKMYGGMLFVVAAGGLMGGYTDANLTFLAKLAKKHDVNHVIIEANFGDGMYTELIKPFLNRESDAKPVGWQCKVEEVKHSKQKELRIIDTLEPVMNQHRLVVDQRVVEEDYRSVENFPPEHAKKLMLFYQLTHISKDRGSLDKDDRLDALAMAVAYWTQQMSMDQDQAQEDHRSALMQKEIDRFLEDDCEVSSPVSSWMPLRN